MAKRERKNRALCVGGLRPSGGIVGQPKLRYAARLMTMFHGWEMYKYDERVL